QGWAFQTFAVWVPPSPGVPDKLTSTLPPQANCIVSYYPGVFIRIKAVLEGRGFSPFISGEQQARLPTNHRYPKVQL
ncbi:MAG: hypothetical protein RIM23_01615, partial [Coleofasciculus sp. G3-WIS-01]|uniref:hypothetical protein n=1 Tax=Coleofasciculus sp. G3-WIS-01 TaxID=3069528 RepID=UPI0032F5A981